MPNVYIEARPKGRHEGTPIEDYVIEDHKDHVLKVFKIQKEAIDWAKKGATIRSSPASGTKTTGRSQITGGRQDNSRGAQSAAFSSTRDLIPRRPCGRKGPRKMLQVAPAPVRGRVFRGRFAAPRGTRSVDGARSVH